MHGPLPWISDLNFKQYFKLNISKTKLLFFHKHPLLSDSTSSQSVTTAFFHLLWLTKTIFIHQDSNLTLAPQIQSLTKFKWPMYFIIISNYILVLSSNHLWCVLSQQAFNRSPSSTFSSSICLFPTFYSQSGSVKIKVKSHHSTENLAKFCCWPSTIISPLLLPSLYLLKQCLPISTEARLERLTFQQMPGILSFRDFPLWLECFPPRYLHGCSTHFLGLFCFFTSWHNTAYCLYTVGRLF